ncbi:MAG: hypothetical protein Q4C91_19980 [Eubacteriales bacterium]|nr:hypothetical protein [Eubacteriales bacterium]
MRKIFIILMICYMGIFHIPSVPQVHSNEKLNENAISEFESLPFQVVMDKTSLETGKSEKVTCYVVSAVDDFSYSVFAENGKISNKHLSSFDYSRPREELTDTINIECTDRTTGREYSISITLFFQTIHQQMS